MRRVDLVAAKVKISRQLPVPSIGTSGAGLGRLARALVLSSAVITSGQAWAQVRDSCAEQTCATNETASTASLSTSSVKSRSSDDFVPYRISVDGEELVDTGNSVELNRTAPVPTSASRVARSNPVLEQANLQTDVDLSKADIQVKFDGLDAAPQLNVSTTDARQTYPAGSKISFIATTNYPDWIERGEIRIHRLSDDPLRPPLHTIAVGSDGRATWVMPDEQGGGKYAYVLRVYDKKGRFDETGPLTVTRGDIASDNPEAREAAIAPGWGVDRTAVRNIQVYGGAVTVHGRHVPTGYDVKVLGRKVPVDNKNAFVVQQILPPGDHDVTIAIDGGKQGGIEFNRTINIPANDWFYIGLADLTVGKRFGDDNIEEVRAGEYDDVYTRGQLAFYVKGKIKGKYILTAAADTGEDEIQNLFNGFDEKDPRQLLKRIDPDDYYPVYGDASTTIEDAPTSGKFYVRLERGDSHVMWGNYKVHITGAEFLRNERVLYGANAVYKSEDSTSFGERKRQVQLYAAQPGTLPARDILRGTGGSAYFLRQQDLSIGSETITVEVRDRVTGSVISRNKLTYGVDYEIDYAQGVVILKQPLNSTTGNDAVVRERAIGGNEVNLVVQYEYTPTLEDVDGYTYGGRAQGWFGDKVRLGITAMNENTEDADQIMYGADIQIRHSERTFIEGEVAQSEGPGFGKFRSADGGLTQFEQPTAGSRDKQATAFRVRGQVAIEDFVENGPKGVIGGHFEQIEGGFASLDREVAIDQRVWGAHFDVQLNERLAVRGVYDHFDDEDGQERDDLQADLKYQINERISASFGARYVNTYKPDASDNGSRTDIGARLDYQIDDISSVYAFGQVTVSTTDDADDNNRIGIGGQTRFTDKIGAKGEISYGTSGVGALAALTYDPTADEHYYVGYELDPDRAFLPSARIDGTDYGGVVLGARRKYDQYWSAYTESNYDIFGRKRTLTSTYGVSYAPDDVWKFIGGIEVGEIDDPFASNFDRKAFSLGANYSGPEGLKAHLKGEFRLEDSDDNTRDRNSYLLAAGLTYKTSDDWQFYSNLDLVISDSDQSSVLDGDYVEGSVGWAYRPVDNDRFNALLKYTFLYDLPGPDQVNFNGSILGPKQRSHIFSVDASYDVNKYLTVGGKYGWRLGEISESRASSDFVTNSAHLGILRADVHVIKKWDLLLEGRVLHIEDTGSDFGAVAAIYRHVGDNLKLGIGYNFGNFSDDLRDVTYDDHGIFLNIVGKL